MNLLNYLKFGLIRKLFNIQTWYIVLCMDCIILDASSRLLPPNNLDENNTYWNKSYDFAEIAHSIQFLSNSIKYIV